MNITITTTGEDVQSQHAPAVAVATPAGVEVATPEFLRVVGAEVLPAGTPSLDAFLEMHGFDRVSATAFVRGEVEIRISHSALSEGFTLAWVHNATAGRAREHRFLRAAAHDLRGPIANVRSFVSLIHASGAPLPPRASRAVDVIQRNADRALALLGELFTSLQDSYGLVELPVDAIPLGPELQGAIDAAVAMGPSRVVLSAEPSALPPVLAEKTALRHALGVVLEWAVVRTPATRYVDVELHPQAEYLSVQVTDGGPQLDEEERARLLDRSFWIEREGKLTLGFRLSVAAAELRAMGGLLTATERHGRTALLAQLRLAGA